LDDKSVIPLGVLASAAQEAKIVLYAATDGNHGRAVARMAQYLGISAKIFVPTMVDEEAKSKIANEGADVEVFDGDYDGTVLHTKEATENHPCGKGLLISDTSLEVGEEVPSWIVEGYQTMFDEIEEQVLAVTRKNTITHVVTPVGVGSLAQAVVTHFRRTPRLERVSIIAVEPVAAACLKASLEAGTMKSVETGYTICTGMCCGTLSVSGWPILRDGVDITVAVEDREVHNAVGELESSDIWAGPCGAACLAGLLNLAKSGVIPRDGKAVVVLLCTEGKRGYKLELGV
jgi:diaminopropionate ammonia-lyase